MKGRRDRLTGFRLHLDGLHRYHGAAATVVAAAGLGMLVTAGLDLGPLWAGFLAGAVPAFVVAGILEMERG